MKLSSVSRSAAWFGATILSLLPLGHCPAADAVADQPLRVLFLGDNDYHRPSDRFKQLQPVLARQRIDVDYVDSLDGLSPGRLAGYDCLLIYANWTRISPDQESALLEFVTRGGGFVAIHCASYCFLNSPKYIELVGGQFQSHGTGAFRENIVRPDHPIMSGLSPIQSWDETRFHTRHNTNRVVLAERREAGHVEPYTWVREHGAGRVFYTAWGHDERTWSNPGFQALVERGIRWASANSLSGLQPRRGLPALEYTEAPAPLPNYVRDAKWGTQGEPIRTMQKPLNPEESMQHLVTFPEFAVSLFAAEPDVAKAIWMAWDERGRLWIAETIDYPNNMQPPGQGHDQIKICEDTDGDGRADKFTVFADKLSVPTSFVFANGGVIVVHSGKTEFLQDTDGDDKADVRRTLFSGWGTGDTHAGPSNLRYGFDNWIWGTVGYSGFQGTVGGKQVRFGQGIYRFKPDGSALEFVRSSNNNTWGLGLSEDNIVFGSTANGNASMYLPIPNRYYEAVNGWSASRLETIADSQRFFPITDKTRQVDYFGRYTAGAGGALYTARRFPREYWNRAQFVAEPTGHLLGRFFLEARGSDFVSHNARNFAASDDEWAAPICAEVGPDGALWMIDWYNYVIQHNPTPHGFQTGKGNAYETPLRDKTHGRIYRIVYKPNPSSRSRVVASPLLRENDGSRAASDQGASTSRVGGERFPLSPGARAGVRGEERPANMAASVPNGQAAGGDTRAPLRLDKATPEQLVATLKNNNMLWRMTAQRLLVTRGQKDVVAALCALAGETNVDEIGLNPAAIHALWTLDGLGALDESGAQAVGAAAAALRHPSAGVRRAALMVLPRNERFLDAILRGKLLEDPDAQVRLAALLAVSEMPASDAAARAIFALLREPRNADDRWIPEAATSAAARNDAGFLRVVLAGFRPAPTAIGNEPHPNLDVQLRQSAGSTLAGELGWVVQRVATHYAERGPTESIVPALAALKGAPEALAVPMLDALVWGWPQGKAPSLGDGEKQVLSDLMQSLPESARDRLLALAQRWGRTDIFGASVAAITVSLKQQITDPAAADDARVTAAKRLIGLDDSQEIVEMVLKQINPLAPPGLATGFIAALTESRDPRTGHALSERWQQLTPTMRRAAIATLMRRADWARALLDGVERGTIDRTDLAAEQWSQLKLNPNAAIARRAEKLSAVGGTISADRQEIVKKLLPLAKEKGDPARGKEVFTATCAVCHTFNAQGGKVGPDLSGIGARDPSEILIDILDPNRSVEANYRLWNVTTKDGETYSGRLETETQTSVEILDTTGQKHIIQRKEMATLDGTQLSIMPNGFEALPPSDLKSLLEFLTEKGSVQQNRVFSRDP